jgi:hypothetical protein
MSTGAPRADAAAASVGATDLFVLRRVRDDRFVHFGGSGRGAGWAGLIEIAGRESDAFDRSLADRLPVRVAHDRKELVFGPYYARGAAFVPVTNDVVVVFGAENDLLDSASDEALQSAGTMAADAVSHVTPAKVLADELEELEAVRATLAVPTEDVAATMRALALVAAEALSCEVGAVYLNDGDKLEVVDRGWQLAARHDGVAGALKAVLEEGRFPYCVQDASVVPPPPPLDGEPGLRSYYLLELHGPARGVLFLAHTDAAPRGFTLLCRRLGLRLADVVSTTLGVALTREWCRSETVRIDDELAKLGPAGSA